MVRDHAHHQIGMHGRGVKRSNIRIDGESVSPWVRESSPHYSVECRARVPVQRIHSAHAPIKLTELLSRNTLTCWIAWKVKSTTHDCCRKYTRSQEYVEHARRSWSIWTNLGAARWWILILHLTWIQSPPLRGRIHEILFGGVEVGKILGHTNLILCFSDSADLVLAELNVKNVIKRLCYWRPLPCAYTCGTGATKHTYSILCTLKYFDFVSRWRRTWCSRVLN